MLMQSTPRHTALLQANTSAETAQSKRKWMLVPCTETLGTTHPCFTLSSVMLPQECSRVIVDGYVANLRYG